MIRRYRSYSFNYLPADARIRIEEFVGTFVMFEFDYKAHGEKFADYRFFRNPEWLRPARRIELMENAQEELRELRRINAPVDETLASDLQFLELPLAPPLMTDYSLRCYSAEIKKHVGYCFRLGLGSREFKRHIEFDCYNAKVFFNVIEDQYQRERFIEILDDDEPGIHAVVDLTGDDEPEEAVEIDVL